VLVTGAGITGRSVSAALEPTGVRLTICDDDPLALQRLVTPASVVTTAEALAQIADYALVVTSPGFPPTAPVLAAAAAASVPIWGDVELAWRLDQAGWFGTPKRMARGDGHQRQDDHDVDAARDAGRCGPAGAAVRATSATRSSTCSPSPPSCSPSSCPVFSFTGRRRCGRRQAPC
jgi:hypothetical protein